MGEASYKQEAFPLLKVLRNLLPKFFIHICHNVLDWNVLILCLDGISLDTGRIVGHSCLVHQGHLYGLPVFRGLPPFQISCKGIFPAFP